MSVLHFPALVYVSMLSETTDYSLGGFRCIFLFCSLFPPLCMIWLSKPLYLSNILYMLALSTGQIYITWWFLCKDILTLAMRIVLGRWNGLGSSRDLSFCISVVKCKYEISLLIFIQATCFSKSFLLIILNSDTFSIIPQTIGKYLHISFSINVFKILGVKKQSLSPVT